MKAILGQKLGMTQIFDDDARAIPVTVVKAGPVHVVQIKTVAIDGYDAVQISYGEMKPGNANKPIAGHYAKAGVAPARHLVEVKVEDPSQYQVGQEIKVDEVFKIGNKADVAGVSKGKGFAGVMKRHNFKGQRASHGAHRVHRKPGAIGQCATPSRVFKGKKMPGRMGGEKVTTQNLEVVEADPDRKLLLVRGSVPGPRGATVVIRNAAKGASAVTGADNA